MLVWHANVGAGVHEHLQVYMLDRTSTYYGIALQLHSPPDAVLDVPGDYGRWVHLIDWEQRWPPGKNRL